MLCFILAFLVTVLVAFLAYCLWAIGGLFKDI